MDWDRSMTLDASWEVALALRSKAISVGGVGKPAVLPAGRSSEANSFGDAKESAP